MLWKAFVRSPKQPFLQHLHVREKPSTVIPDDLALGANMFTSSRAVIAPRTASQGVDNREVARLPLAHCGADCDHRPCTLVPNHPVVRMFATGAEMEVAATHGQILEAENN